jgi:hypothetical protein
MPRRIGEPTISATGNGRSGVWYMNDLGGIRSTTLWHANPSLADVTIIATQDGGTYPFPVNIGDPDPNKVLYILASGSGTGTTGITGITVEGSAATILASRTGSGTAITHLALAAIKIDAVTTTSTVTVTFGSTVNRAGVTVFKAFPNAMEALATTTQAPTTTSTAESISFDIPPGGFVISAMMMNLLGTTSPFVSGATQLVSTSYGAEGNFLAVALTSPTTALRLGHTITTTHTSGGASLALLSAMMR